MVATRRMEGMSAPSTGTPATAPTRKGSKAALQEVASFANNLRKSSFCLWSKIQKIKTGGKATGESGGWGTSVPDNPRSRRPSPTTDDRACGKALLCARPTVGLGSRGRGRSRGSSAFTLVPTDQRDISSPGRRRGVPLAGFRGSRRGGKGTESWGGRRSVQGGRACQAGDRPACPAAAGQLRRKAECGLKASLTSPTASVFKSAGLHET